MSAVRGALRGGDDVGPRDRHPAGLEPHGRTFPFWATFWKELGHRPVLSEATSQETLALGLTHLSVGVCLPIKRRRATSTRSSREGVDRGLRPRGRRPARRRAVPLVRLPLHDGRPVHRRRAGRRAPPLAGRHASRARRRSRRASRPFRDRLGVSSDADPCRVPSGAWAQEEFDALFRERVPKELARRAATGTSSGSWAGPTPSTTRT